MDRIRLVAVGTGYFSQFQYEAWSRIEEVVLVGICSRHREGAWQVANRYNVPACYEDFSGMLDETRPDLVDIITPPDTHLDFIRMAAQRRVNVICQKPFCTSLEEAHEAVQVAEEAGITLIIHENVRFQPWYAEVRHMIKEDRLGELYQARFCLRPGDGQGADAYLARQPYFQSMKRFLMHETGIHWIDTFRYLFGDVDSVFAQLRRLNPVIAGEDAGLVILNFRSGVQAVFDGNRLVDHSAENRRLTMGELTIEGAGGALTLDGNATLRFRNHGQNRLDTIDYDWENRNFGGDCVYLCQRHAIGALQGHHPVANSGRDYLRNLEVEQAIYLSSDEGRLIRVNQSNQEPEQ